LPLQILKPGYGRGSAKIVSAIRVFCFEGHSVSRCNITSNTFFINHHFGGVQSWAATALFSILVQFSKIRSYNRTVRQTV